MGKKIGIIGFTEHVYEAHTEGFEGYELGDILRIKDCRHKYFGKDLMIVGFNPDYEPKLILTEVMGEGCVEIWDENDLADLEVVWQRKKASNYRVINLLISMRNAHIAQFLKWHR